MLQTSGFYKALLTTSDEVEVNTHDSHRLPWPVLDHGLYFHNHPVSYTNYDVTVFFLIIFLSLMYFRCIVGFPIYLHLLMRVLYY